MAWTSVSVPTRCILVVQAAFVAVGALPGLRRRLRASPLFRATMIGPPLLLAVLTASADLIVLTFGTWCEFPTRAFLRWLLTVPWILAVSVALQLILAKEYGEASWRDLPWVACFLGLLALLADAVFLLWLVERAGL